MPGPKPKPTHLKVLAGNPGKRKLNEREPKPARGIPKMPKLEGAAADAWKLLAPMLDRMGVLTEAEASALALLCEAFEDYSDAREVIRSAGSTYTTTNQQGDTMYRPRPEYAHMKDAWERIWKGLGDFGLTPAARTKVQRIVEPDNDEERFFGAG